MVQLLRDTVSGNVDTFFAAIRHGIPVTQVEPPTAALEYARRLAQREISADALCAPTGWVTGRRWRRTQRDPHVEHRATTEPQRVRTNGDDLVRLHRLISQRVIATYQEEREHWVENRNSLRTLQVRELLAGGDADIDAMTTAIRYPLRGIHLAVVVWCPEFDDGAEPAALEPSVRKLADRLAVKTIPCSSRWTARPVGMDSPFGGCGGQGGGAPAQVGHGNQRALHRGG